VEFNVADLFESVASEIPEREALAFNRADGTIERRTYAELDERANRLANALADSGVGPGDHIGLQLYNGQEYIEGMIAAFKLRAVPINVNYRYVASELAYLFADADIKAVLSEEDLSDRVDDIVDALPLLDTVLYVGDRYEAALAAASPDRPDVGTRSGDDRYLLYTGGTTGMPKGVMWRQEDWYFAALGGREGQHPTDIAPKAVKGSSLPRRLPLCPLMHGSAQWVVWQTFLAGGTVVLSTDRRFEAAAALDLIANESVSLVMVVGDAVARPIGDALDSEPARWDLSGLKVFSSGGAVLTSAVSDRIQVHVPHLRINNTFGASETGGQGRMIKGSDAEGSPRLATDGTTMVVDDNFVAIEPGSGEIGKLARRGHIPLGYYKDEKKTAVTFPEVDGVRWSVPGDLAQVDYDGSIILLGRGSASINTGGEKVFPEEVEGVLKSHEAIFDAYVVGVPDELYGQRVTAVVQYRTGVEPPQDDEIVTHCRTQLSGYKVPRLWVAVEELQRLPTGKADYRWAQDVVKASVG